MIEITLRVDEIDYDALADLLLPALLERVENDSIGRFFIRSPEAGEQMARKLLERMSQEQKDALLTKFLSSNREKGAALLQNMAAQNGVKLRVTDLEARTV